MKTLKPYLLLGCFIAAAHAVHAQAGISPAIINTTGGSANSQFSLEWSVGEMTTVNAAASGHLAVNAGILQGQPWQVMAERAAVKPSLFPNPVSRTAYLTYRQPARGTVQCQFTDATGKLLKTYNFQHAGGTSVYDLDVQGLPGGSFYCIIRFSPITGVSAPGTDILKVVKQ